MRLKWVLKGLIKKQGKVIVGRKSAVFLLQLPVLFTISNEAPMGYKISELLQMTLSARQYAMLKFPLGSYSFSIAFYWKEAYKYSICLVFHWKKKIIYDLFLYQSKQHCFPEVWFLLLDLQRSHKLLLLMQSLLLLFLNQLFFFFYLSLSSRCVPSFYSCLFMCACVCVCLHSMYWPWVYSSVTPPPCPLS